MMTIQQMQYFYEVCRWQHMTKAAEELHISQSTLSLAIKNIERETGLNLFLHVGRNIQMTEDGHALFQSVTELLKKIDHFDAGVKALAHQHSTLKVAVPTQIGNLILPLLLGPFRQQHPDIPLSIIEPGGMEAIQLVEQEEIDLAFVHDADRDDLICRPLMNWPICLCMRKDNPLAQKSSVTLEEALSHPLILLFYRSIITRRILQESEKRHIKANVIHYTPHLASIWNIVQRNIALSIITGNSILPNSQLCTVPIEGLYQHGYIITKKGRQVYKDQRTLIRFMEEQHRLGNC